MKNNVLRALMLKLGVGNRLSLSIAVSKPVKWRTEKMPTQKFDLEERLLHYSAQILRLVESLANTRTANHVGGQLLRSGTSPYFNHGEAQAAESINDFVHKMRICLKELNESFRCLRLIKAVPLIKPPSKVDELLSKTEELIKIFFKHKNSREEQS